jgi:hypothetical protein
MTLRAGLQVETKRTSSLEVHTGSPFKLNLHASSEQAPKPSRSSSTEACVSGVFNGGDHKQRPMGFLMRTRRADTPKRLPISFAFPLDAPLVTYQASTDHGD